MYVLIHLAPPGTRLPCQRTKILINQGERVFLPSGSAAGWLVCLSHPMLWLDSRLRGNDGMEQVFNRGEPFLRLDSRLRGNDGVVILQSIAEW